MNRILKNLKLLRYQFFFWGWLPENVILVLYFNQVLDSYALAGLVFMFRYWAISLFEIPTGIFSDKIGRRYTLILSGLCYLLVKVFYILAFWMAPLIMLLLASVFYGVAESLSSGTNEAVVYENVAKLKKKDFPNYYGKIKACHTLGIGISALFGGMISSIVSMYAVMWLSLFGTLAHIYFSWCLTEVGFTPSSRKVFSQFWVSLCSIWKDRSLKSLFVAELLSHSGDRGQGDMMPAYLGALIPYWVMGLWRFAGRGINFFSFWFVKRFFKLWGLKRCYIYSIITGPVSILVGLIFNNILTPFIFLGDYIFHGIGYIAKAQIKQDRFTNTQRATMESVFSMADNVCAGIAVFIIGIIAQETNVIIAILSALVFKFAAFPFYFRVLKSEKVRKFV